jgi:uncharacterized protein
VLRQLYGTLTIPPAVYSEMANIGKTVPGTLAVQTLPWITVQPVADSNQVETLRAILDPGEAEAIVLALDLRAELLILDERPERAESLQQGLFCATTPRISKNIISTRLWARCSADMLLTVASK